MKEIQLTKGKVALVDDADYEWLNQWKWRAWKGNSTFYAVRSIYNGRKQVGVLLMHRVLYGVTDPKIQVDHKDHNGLNNTRQNTRVCTPLQNARNRQSLIGSSSKYLGVSKDKKGGGWQATISANKKSIGLGSFDLEKDAALAYDRAAEKYFGEFANLNFPSEKNIPQRRKRKRREHGYRGVEIHGKKIRMRIKIDGIVRLSLHETIEQAALAYNDAAIKIFGDKAELNIV